MSSSRSTGKESYHLSTFFVLAKIKDSALPGVLCPRPLYLSGSSEVQSVLSRTDGSQVNLGLPLLQLMTRIWLALGHMRPHQTILESVHITKLRFWL